MVKNKKGQVFENLGALGVGIATLGILLVVSFLIMGQGKTSVVSQTTANSVLNESFTLVNGTATTLDSQCAAVGCSALYNDTSTGFLIGAGNYTCAVNAGGFTATITPVIEAVGNVSPTLYLDYSCTPPSLAFNATSTLQSATDDIPGWVPLIVIAVIGSLLLGLVALLKRNFA